MRIKNLKIVVGFACICFAASCKKTNIENNTAEYETTFELSASQGIDENLSQDAGDVLSEVTADKNLQGSGFSTATTEGNFISCAAVTVAPLQGFPKTITIDFGTGCTSQSGVNRSGKIIVLLSDSLKHSGSTASMSFDNYYVSGFKKEGNIVFTNTSTASSKSFHRSCTNGKVTAPGGNYWLHAGEQDVVQTAGLGTPTLLDDVVTITGHRSTTNAAGNTRAATIQTALQKKFACSNIDMGIVRIEGPNHYAIVDYGDGTCDRIATISIDGRPARTFLLRN